MQYKNSSERDIYKYSKRKSVHTLLKNYKAIRGRIKVDNYINLAENILQLKFKRFGKKNTACA
jgi:hypothetical protein